ncbi:hypothetical protein, partial [Gluconobacter sp. P1D12_c]|uniref:hypothetical protein n=1 Tax=Gluconobacter sp. P1D12_c TaxID=2762614 RepID=UPI001C03C117
MNDLRIPSETTSLGGLVLNHRHQLCYNTDVGRVVTFLRHEPSPNLSGFFDVIRQDIHRFNP